MQGYWEDWRRKKKAKRHYALCANEGGTGGATGGAVEGRAGDSAEHAETDTMMPLASAWMAICATAPGTATTPATQHATSAGAGMS